MHMMAQQKRLWGIVKWLRLKLGNDVFIGYGSVILPGVTIGNKVIVGAGTICSRDIPDNSVVVRGIDTIYRILCTYDEYIDKQKKRLETLPVSNKIFSERTDDEWKRGKEEFENAGGDTICPGKKIVLIT